MAKCKCPQVDDLARRDPKTKKIWINPLVPKTYAGVPMRRITRNYEKDYYYQREVKHKSDIEAREHAIKVQYKNVPRSKILKVGAKFDSIEDPAHQDRSSRVSRPCPKRKQKPLFLRVFEW
jgi:hypothetical protein